MKTTLSTIVVGMIFLGLYYSPDVMAANNNPCSDDIALFCKDSKRSPASLMDCLERNESKLSPACKEYEVKMGGKKHEVRESMRDRIRFRQNCAADVEKFCKNAEPGQGAVAKCLNEHKNEVSAPCSASMNEIDEISSQPRAK